MADQRGSVAAAAASKSLECRHCDMKFTSLLNAMAHSRSPEHLAKMQETTGVEKPAAPIEQKRDTVSEEDRMRLQQAEDGFKHDFLVCPADVDFHQFLATNNVFQPAPSETTSSSVPQ